RTLLPRMVETSGSSSTTAGVPGGELEGEAAGGAGGGEGLSGADCPVGGGAGCPVGGGEDCGACASCAVRAEAATPSAGRNASPRTPPGAIRPMAMTAVMTRPVRIGPPPHARQAATINANEASKFLAGNVRQRFYSTRTCSSRL